MEPLTDPTAAPAATRRRRVLAFFAGLALVLAALCLTFNHVLVTDPARLSGLYDVHRYFGPLAFYMDTCIQSGEFPLWNPVSYCGMPYAANPQVAALYPPNLLRSALTFAPTPYRTQFGLVVLMGLHLLLAFGGTYLLARSHRISRSGAWTAALAFTFSALMVRRVCEYHFVYTLNWLPLLLFLAKQLLDAPAWQRKFRWGVAAGLVFGMATLGGFFQIVNYMGVALVAYMLLYRLLHPGAGAVRRGGDEGRRDACGTGEGRRDACGTWMLRAWACDGATLAVVGVVALLVAGALLFPALELARFTGRQPGVAVPMYSNLYDRLWVGIAQDAIVYPGMKYDAEALRGSGVVALILSIAALFTSRRREVLLFAGVYLVLLDCSFGPPLPVSWLVNKLTPFAPSAYSRAYDLALLPLSLLAGLGVDGIMRKPRAGWAALLETMLLTVTGGALLLLLWKWMHPAHYLGITPWVAAIPALALLVMVTARAFPRVGAVAALLPVLVFLETLAWNAGYVPMMTRLRIPPIPAQTASMPQDNHRQTDAKANRQLFRMGHLINGYDPLNLRQTWEALVDPVLARKYSRLARQDSMAENQRTNLLFKRSLWLARQWVKGPLPGKSSLFPAATTVFLPDAANLATPQSDADALKNSGVSDNVRQQSVMTPLLREPVKAGAKVRRELRLSLPVCVDGRPAGPAGAVHSVLRLHYRGSCSGSIETVFKDRSTGQVELGKKTLLSASTGTAVELPLPDCASMDAVFTVTTPGGSGLFEITGAELLSDNNDEDGLIRIASRGANRVELDVGPLDGPRILACLDAWYPGWHAYVDGAEASLLRADDGFKAVEIPRGTHHVTFVFRPMRVYAGIALSLATLAAAGLMWLFYPSRGTGPV
jgi:hypothetical protein